MDGTRYDKAHCSVSSLASVSRSGDLPSVSLGPVRVLVAQLPTRGLPRLSRSRASPRPALWVQGLGGTASERITTVLLDSIRVRLCFNGTGPGHPGHRTGVRGRCEDGAAVAGRSGGAAAGLLAARP